MELGSFRGRAEDLIEKENWKCSEELIGYITDYLEYLRVKDPQKFYEKDFDYWEDEIIDEMRALEAEGMIELTDKK